MQLSNTFHLIIYKAFADVKSEASRSYIGLLWWIIEPILYLGAFYVLFVLVFKRGDGDFITNFLCGIVLWKWFDFGVRSSINSIISNKGLIQNIYVPKYVFPTIMVLESLIRFIPVFLIFVVYLIVFTEYFDIHWYRIFILFLVEGLLILSIGLLFSAIVPFLPDIKVAIDNIMLFVFFISGIFFDISKVDGEIRDYLYLNPIALIINEARNILLKNNHPDYSSLMLISIVSIIVILFSFKLLARLDKKYAKVRF